MNRLRKTLLARTDKAPLKKGEAPGLLAWAKPFYSSLNLYRMLLLLSFIPTAKVYQHTGPFWATLLFMTFLIFGYLWDKWLFQRQLERLWGQLPHNTPHQIDGFPLTDIKAFMKWHMETRLPFYGPPLLLGLLAHALPFESWPVFMLPKALLIIALLIKTIVGYKKFGATLLVLKTLNNMFLPKNRNAYYTSLHDPVPNHHNSMINPLNPNSFLNPANPLCHLNPSNSHFPGNN